MITVPGQRLRKLSVSRLIPGLLQVAGYFILILTKYIIYNNIKLRPHNHVFIKFPAKFGENNFFSKLKLREKMKPVQKEGQTDVLGQKVENCDQCFLNKTGISKRFGFSILGGRFLDSFVVRF